MKKNILMIRASNSCRSPIAEAVMNFLIKKTHLENYFQVECASIKDNVYQVIPDSRVFSVLNRHGVPCNWRPNHIQPDEFKNYDYIFAMDDRCLEDVKSMVKSNINTQFLLLGDFGLKPEDRNICDPFHFVGEGYFEKVYNLCYAASLAFLTHVSLENYSINSQCEKRIIEL